MSVRTFARTTRAMHACLAATLSLVLAPPPASAQQAPAASGTARLHRVLDSVAVGSTRRWLQVETIGGARVYGVHLGHDGDTLRLSAPASAGGRAVPLHDVTMLWRQRGTHAARGGALGAVTGALVLGVLGPGLSGLGGDGAQRPCTRSCALHAALGGAMLGGSVGLVMGTLHRRWQRVYAAGER